MNPTYQRWLLRFKSLGLPVCGLGLTYAIVIDRPMQQQIIEAEMKLTKLQGLERQKAQDHATNRNKLTELQRSQTEPTRLVSSGEPEPSATTPVHASREAPNSALDTLSSLLTLLDRNQLRCLSSQPVDRAAESSVAETPANGKLSKATTPVGLPSTTVPERVAMRLTLAGKFQDMHRALEEITTHIEGVSIVSLEMEASEEDDSIHRWIIVLLV